jgi:hypothetical protein
MLLLGAASLPIAGLFNRKAVMRNLAFTFCEKRIEELVEQWTNGNRESVISECRGKSPWFSAKVCFGILRATRDGDDAMRFCNLLKEGCHDSDDGVTVDDIGTALDSLGRRNWH